MRRDRWLRSDTFRRLREDRELTQQRQDVLDSLGPEDPETAEMEDRAQTARDALFGGAPEFEDNAVTTASRKRKAPPPPPEETPGRWMDVKQCAAYIRRSVKAVYHLAESGTLPCTPQGRRLFFDKGKIDRWMERHARRGSMVK